MQTNHDPDFVKCYNDYMAFLGVKELYSDPVRLEECKRHLLIMDEYCDSKSIEERAQRIIESGKRLALRDIQNPALIEKLKHLTNLQCADIMYAQYMRKFGTNK